MDQATLLWTLAGTVFAGLALFMQKMVAEERRDGALFGVVSYGISGAIGGVVLLFLPELPPNWEILALFGLSSGAIHGVANFTRIESLKYIDSVIFFPINKMLGPLLVVVGAIFFFQEHLGLVQYIGIGLSLTVPLLLITGAEQQRQNNLTRGLQFLVVSTLFSTFAVLVAKQGFSYGSSVAILMCTSQIAGTIASAAIVLQQRGMTFSLFAHGDRRDVYLGIWSGVISFVSSWCLFEGLKSGLVSLVYVIQAHYILIPIVLSVWWYRDHINMRKFAAVVVSFFAIALLAT